MAEPRKCAGCGVELAADTLGEQCPQCLARLANAARTTAAFEPQKRGARIGPYRLLEPLGEGGCGVVWVAEQTEPVRRRVALKVIKLGMDTREVVARFEAERQVLALMDHPNIAKVFDAGTTEEGRPYFVMELVKGSPITRYCDEKKLATPERLRLFIQVCEAVQHAHLKGIIHRDLKPSNILVADHEGKGVPVVIDFGIAKATAGQTLTDKTLYTALEQFIGTPAYMSPEQAKLSSADIDTRSDIYSLGVLLYELLTGRTPFDARELRAAGLDEIRRIIREVEPPRPSTKLSTLDASEQTAIARCRQTEAPKLIHLVRGDLDWIVLKTLEKDRSRRYETANGLAREIERYLHDEPVVARPPSPVYRLQKLVRRNKLAFASSCAVIAALLVGLALFAWQFIEKNRAYAKIVLAEKEQRRLAAEAQKEAAKSREVAHFLADMLKGVGPSVAQGMDTKLLRKILDQTAERLDKDLKAQPEVEAELRHIIGEVYRSLGEFKSAEAMQRQALALRRSLFGEDNLQVAESVNDLAAVLDTEGDLAGAEALFRQALSTRQKLLGKEHPDVAASLANLAGLLQSEGRLPESQAMQRDALAMRRKLLGPEHSDIASSLNGLAIVCVYQGKLADAESLFREAYEMKRKLLGPKHPEVAQCLDNLSLVLADQGKFAESETLSRQALAMRRELLGNDHPDTGRSLQNLASVLARAGKLAEAETQYREAMALMNKFHPDGHPATATILNNLALLFQREDKLDQAEAFHRQALAMRRKLLPEGHPDVASSLNNLAATLLGESRLPEAEALLREALAMRRKLWPNDHPSVAETLDLLSGVLLEEGKLTEAESLGRQALAMNQKTLPAGHPAVAQNMNQLGGILYKEKKLPEAEAMYRQALELRRKAFSDEHQDVAQTLNDLGSVLGAEGKLTEAERTDREALAMRRKLLPADHLEIAESLDNLADLLQEHGNLAEAESLTRECLAIRKKKVPDEWRMFDARARLGSILAQEKKYAEAEPLLSSGCAGLLAQLDKMPASGMSRSRQTVRQLVQLYEATGDANNAQLWRKKLSEMENKP